MSKSDTEISETKKQKTEKHRPMDKIIEFLVPNAVYQILVQKSLENKLGKNPNKYVRSVIIDSLTMNDEKSIKRAIALLDINDKKIETILKFIMKWMESMTTAHYASHPEPQPDQKKTVSAAAIRRKNEHYKLLMSMTLEEGGATILEKILADMIETKE
jgi:hypothetical protein